MCVSIPYGIWSLVGYIRISVVYLWVVINLFSLLDTVRTHAYILIYIPPVRVSYDLRARICFS